MKSCAVPTSAALYRGALFLLLAAIPALADRKDDLYAQGVQALNAGKAVEANDAFCQVARLDAGYQDAQKQCADTKAAADRVVNFNTQTYADALNDIDAGKLDEAEAQLKRVRYGPHAADAQKKLAEVARLKEEKRKADEDKQAAAAQAAALNARFNQGVSAWNNGKFDDARAAFTGLGGPHAPEAADYLDKIKQYENLMQQAAEFERGKNYSAAAGAYNQAGLLHSKGPGDPFAKALQMNRLAASTPQPASAPPASRPSRSDDSGAASASRDLPQASDGLAQPASRGKPKSDDPILAESIRQFYLGNYQAAETVLNKYIAGGGRPGLGNFYLGASLLTRYYLSGELDAGLKQAAMQKFAAARAVNGFKVPGERVSPKILAVYDQASK